ncbi:hypothetical protein DFJ43DRAFT_610237 [Lentinula guzmanii]|uniref:Uncharacterized protein n=3 Tax=Lentinula TaxID=5352 RepID=A0AA38MXA6_9AGAR|nr:hypothetical protein DFJ43DRAFT_610237 [Lentinula guzmanii]KAJ3741111.1 hypothetical protein DFH05DRAFT_303251 [Lentinula detonsa]KAJ3785467.1 hypothetical protein GGU10DRAFT_354831 [Lentinula aff. detonsa]KAJ3985886.1 hypothetical protein F5890DRAFT_1082823 [Lentinula detonsa]
MTMDRFLAPHTPEAVAYTHVSQNSADIHSHHLDFFDENLVAYSASYHAFERYLSGVDLFILPRMRSELESVLRRYSYDSIHNAISSSRSTLQPGGYGRVCHYAEASIRNVLNTNDNAAILLSMHVPKSAANNHERNERPTQTIITK